MHHLLDSVELSLQTKNWEAALLTSLNLPEICAKLEGIEKQGKTNRYVLWARRWFEKTDALGPPEVRGNSIPIRKTLLSPEQSHEEKMEILRNEWNERTQNDEMTYELGHLMKAEDLYALRCAFTHAAEHDVSEQNINQTLSSFYIVSPVNGVVFHGNTDEDKNRLQIQVDMFCREITAAVEAWIETNSTNHSLLQKISAMPKIEQIKSF